jgi:hypothetical protein
MTRSKLDLQVGCVYELKVFSIVLELMQSVLFRLCKKPSVNLNLVGVAIAIVATHPEYRQRFADNDRGERSLLK